MLVETAGFTTSKGWRSLRRSPVGSGWSSSEHWRREHIQRQHGRYINSRSRCLKTNLIPYYDGEKFAFLEWRIWKHSQLGCIIDIHTLSLVRVTPPDEFLSNTSELDDRLSVYCLSTCWLSVPLVRITVSHKFWCFEFRLCLTLYN